MRTNSDPGRRRPAVAVPAILVLALAAGCGGGPARVPCHPASGTVVVDGRPAAGVQVMLHPSGRIGDLDALRPTAVTGDDGGFEVGTYEPGDGAPEGRYKVTLFLPDAPPTGSNSPEDLLGGRYLDPRTSPLEAEVVPGENRLGPFEVRTAPRPARPSRTSPRPDSDGVG